MCRPGFPGPKQTGNDHRCPSRCFVYSVILGRHDSQRQAVLTVIDSKGCQGVGVPHRPVGRAEFVSPHPVHPPYLALVAARLTPFRPGLTVAAQTTLQSVPVALTPGSAVSVLTSLVHQSWPWCAVGQGSLAVPADVREERACPA